MQDEQWKPIKELNNEYEISNYGRMKSIDRIKNDRKIKGRILKPSFNRGGGYPYFRLSLDGKKLSLTAHRLVAIYFVPNPDNKLYVNHIDSNRKNSYYQNLEWVTHSENMRHGKDFGFVENPFGSKARNFKFYVEVIDKDGNIVDTLCGNKDMNEKGYDHRLINACFTGRQKTHRNCTFRKVYK